MTSNGEIETDVSKVTAPDFSASEPKAKPAFAFVGKPSDETSGVAALITTAVAVAAGVGAAAAPLPSAESSSDVEGTSPTPSAPEASVVAGPPADAVAPKPGFVRLDVPEDETELQAPDPLDVKPIDVEPVEVVDLDLGSTTPVTPTVVAPTVALPATATAPVTKLPTDIDWADLVEMLGRGDGAEPSPAEGAPSEGMATAKLLAGRFGVKMEALRASLEDRLDAFKFDDVTVEAPVDEAPLDPFSDAINPMWMAEVVEAVELAGLPIGDEFLVMLSDLEGILPPQAHDTPDGFIV